MDPLTPKELSSFRAQLTTLAGDLNATLAKSADRSRPVELTTAQGRVSRADAMQQQQMALAEERRIEARLRGIDGALKRLDEGCFGECTRCGEDILRRRLSIRPESALCMPCASAVGG
ncbi:MAG: TraR/DksA family transcriptional regulator [Myxococcota bacterium]